MDTISRWHRVEKKSWASYIQTELEEMQSNPSDDFKCLALKSNPYDWQFAIKGPNGTEFEGGIYHGRIQFSEENPDKPPIFTLLTENGRFKTQTEICFRWSFRSTFWAQPVGVREALLELIELLPTYPDGALGSVEYDKEERRILAIKSREAAPRYGTAERQKLIDEIHEYMLSKVSPVPSKGGGDIWVSSQNDRDKRKRAKRIQYLIGNTINANNSKRVGIFDFGKKSSKKAKLVQ
ncbi:hypothetical protein ACE6H2_016491 [Prunus campanulata]